jgi:hypothetical protein
MSDASPFFAIRTLAINTSGWTPITCPVACNYWIVRSSINMNICSDSTSPSTTQDTIPAGVQEGVVAKQNPTPLTGTRYPAGTTFAYLQAQSGSGEAVATFAV